MLNLALFICTIKILLLYLHTQNKTDMKAKTKITKEQMLKMERAISRNIELENGLRINHHKVHKSKKSYNRQENKKLANYY